MNSRESTPCLICHCVAPLRERGCVEDVVSGEPYTLVECAHCHVLRTLPVPTDLAPHYASELGQLMKMRGSRLYATLKSWWVKRELRRIADQLDGAVAVDVGCGSGEVAALLHQQGVAVIAADADETPPPALAGLDRLTYCSMAFDTYELRGFPQPGRPLVVVVRHVLEHLVDPLAFLQRMMAYGASSFYLVVPNATCTERYVFDRYWNLWDPPRHLWHFNIHAMCCLLELAGLQVVRMGYDTIPNVIPSLYRWLRLHRVPECRLSWLRSKGALTTLCAPLNLLLPGNVLWCVARRVEERASHEPSR